jgi:HEAT repeat protein
MTRLLPILLLLAACGGAAFEGKDATAWAAELADPERGGAAMETLQTPEAVPVLVEILDGHRQPDETRARIQAAAVLGRLGADGKEAVPALIEAMKAKDPGVRGMAAVALGRMGDAARPALVALDRALGDPSQRVRVAAALAVYGIAGDRDTAHGELLRAMSGGSPGVRAMVAEALGELGEKSVDILVVAMADEEPRVRAAAATSLGQLRTKDPLAREALDEALQDKEAAVRGAASLAIKLIEADAK